MLERSFSSDKQPVPEKATRVAAIKHFADSWNKGAASTSSVELAGWEQVGIPKTDIGGTVTYWKNENFPGVHIGLSEPGPKAGFMGSGVTRCFIPDEKGGTSLSIPDEYAELRRFGS